MTASTALHAGCVKISTCDVAHNFHGHYASNHQVVSRRATFQVTRLQSFSTNIIYTEY